MSDRSDLFRSLKLGVVFSQAQDGVGCWLADAFAANGCNVHTLLPGDVAWPDGIDLFILYGPMGPLAKAILRLERLDDRDQRVVVWYTEPMPSPGWPEWLTGWLADTRFLPERWLVRLPYKSRLPSVAGRLRAVGEMRFLQRRGWLDLLAVFTLRHQQFFRKWNLPAATIPMGYHPDFGEALGLERDIDVVFMGSTRDRRRKQIVCDLQAQFARTGIRFVLKDGSPQHGAVYGRDRVMLLNRTKIMLNIMRSPWDDPVFRLLLSAPNGAMMLSEPVTDAGPFEAERHFAVAELPTLIEAVHHYLDDERERSRIAHSAFEYVTQELTMERMALRLLRTWYAGLDMASDSGIEATRTD